mgnify:FL=1
MTTTPISPLSDARQPSPPRTTHNLTSLLRIAWLSFGMAYWALLPQFYHVYQVDNRYSLAWDWSLYGSILAAMATLGGIYFAISGVLCFLGRFHPIAARWNPWILGGLAGALVLRTVLALLDKGGWIPPALVAFLNLRLIKAGIYLLPLIGLMAFRRWLLKGWRVFSLTVSLLAGWFLLVPWTWETYGWDAHSLPDPPPRYFAKTNSVHIFMLDAWSFDRTFSGTNLTAEMPHLAKLLSHSDLFSDAQSCGSCTPISIPRFLFQSDEQVMRLSAQEIVQHLRNRQFRDTSFTSLFELSSQHYASVLGYYLHYPALMGSRVHFCSSFSEDTNRQRNRRMRTRLINSQLEFMRHLGFHPRLQAPAISMNRMFADIQEATRMRWGQVMQALPPMSISFSHICFPHEPFQYRRDGSMRSEQEWPPSSSADGYQDNLVEMDNLLGHLFDIMKRQGVYDSSLIVLTSDHTWVHDPENRHPDTWQERLDDDLLPRSPFRHVPLIIKHPAQTAPRHIPHMVSLNNLHYLLDRYLNHPEQTMYFQWWDFKDTPIRVLQKPLHTSPPDP